MTVGEQQRSVPSERKAHEACAGEGVCGSRFLNALSLFVQAVPQEVPRELHTGNTLLPRHSVVSEPMYSDCT